MKIKNLLVCIALLTLVSCSLSTPPKSQERYDEGIKMLDAASTDEERFYALNIVSKEAFVVGKHSEARQYATELETLTPKFKGNWNYGNAVQDSNLVLGRLALKQGNIEQAKDYLLAAGRGPGSPQMDTFGPNLSLAKDLLDKGEREVVLKYLDLCRSFWKMDRGRLQEWSKKVEAGGSPDFGANLLY